MDDPQLEEDEFKWKWVLNLKEHRLEITATNISNRSVTAFVCQDVLLMAEECGLWLSLVDVIRDGMRHTLRSWNVQ